jgi:hypothetical protein
MRHPTGTEPESDDGQFQGRPEVSEDLGRDGPAGPERRPEVPAQSRRGPAEILVRERAIETDAGAEFGNAVRGDLRVGAEHDRNRIARNEADHEKDDHRDAEQNDGEIGDAREKKPFHAVKGSGAAFRRRRFGVQRRVALRRVQSERLAVTS